MTIYVRTKKPLAWEKAEESAADS